jgi:hypothetical protein
LAASHWRVSSSASSAAAVARAGGGGRCCCTSSAGRYAAKCANDIPWCGCGHSAISCTLRSCRPRRE